MHWATIDFPGMGVAEYQVDDDLVDQLPTPEEIAGWIREAEAAVAGRRLDPYLAWGCTDCDEAGEGQDGDGAESPAGAVAHAISSLLWGGMTGSVEDHWCKVARVEAFLDVEEGLRGDEEAEEASRLTVLTLRLKDGRIQKD